VHPHRLPHHHVVQAPQPAALPQDTLSIRLRRRMMAKGGGLVELGVLLVESAKVETGGPMTQFEVQRAKRWQYADRKNNQSDEKDDTAAHQNRLSAYLWRPT